LTRGSPAPVRVAAVTLLEYADTKTLSATTLESALSQFFGLKFFRINTYGKIGEGEGALTCSRVEARAYFAGLLNSAGSGLVFTLTS
jgi:hypothetical protein